MILNVSLSPRPCWVHPFGPTSGNPKRMAGMVVKAPGHQGSVMSNSPFFGEKDGNGIE